MKKNVFFIVLMFNLMIVFNSQVFAEATLKNVHVHWMDDTYVYNKVISDKGIFDFKQKTTNLGMGDHILVDGNGKVLDNTVYQNVYGVATFIDNKQKITKKRVLNEEGKSRFPSDYTELYPSYDGKYFTFQKKIGDTYKYGIMNENGEEILRAKYDYISPVFAQLASARMKNKSGIIDVNGNVVLAFDYDDSRVTNAKVAGVKKNGEWYFVDFNGKKIPKNYNFTYVGFDDLLYFDSPVDRGICDEFRDYADEGFLRIYKGEKEGVCDAHFNIILEPIYDNIIYNDDHLMALKDGLWQIYIIKEKKMMKSNLYDVSLYHNNQYTSKENQFAYIEDRKNKLKGLVNGEEIILQPEYREIIVTDENIYARSHDGKKSDLKKFDLKGQFLGMQDESKSLYYQNGIGFVNDLGANDSGFVDEDGKVILKDEFSIKTPFINGSCVIEVKKDHGYQYGILNLSEIKKLGE